MVVFKIQFWMIVTLGGWGGFERTDFRQFPFWQDAAVSSIIHRKWSCNGKLFSDDTGRGRLQSLLRSLGTQLFELVTFY